MKKLFLLLLFVTSSCFSDTLKIHVPWAPGGATDVAARAFAKELSDQYGIDAIVLNKSGAEGMVGINDFVNQKPDGTHIMFTGSGSIVYNSVINTSNYETIRRLVPISKLTVAGQMMLTKKDSDIKTFKQLVQLSKSKSVSIGTNSSLARELIAELFPNNPNIIVVPFNGDAPTLNGLLSNTVDAVLTTFVFQDRVIRGEVNGLAVSTTHGKFGMPSFNELGYGVIKEQWWGVFAPPGTTTEVRNQLAANFDVIKNKPSFKKSIDFVQHAEVAKISTPNEFRQSIEKEYHDALRFK